MKLTKMYTTYKLYTTTYYIRFCKILNVGIKLLPKFLLIHGLFMWPVAAERINHSSLF